MVPVARTAHTPADDRQRELDFSRADQRAAVIQALPITRPAKRFLEALALLCWRRSGGAGSGGPLPLAEIARSMDRKIDAVRRARREIPDRYLTVSGNDGGPGNAGDAREFLIHWVAIVDDSGWSPETATGPPGKPQSVPPAKSQGPPLHSARGSHGDPHSKTLEIRRVSRSQSAETKSFFNLAKGRWPKEITRTDLLNGQRVDQLWRIAVDVGHLADIQATRHFVHCTARQACAKAKRSPGGFFTAAVARKTPGCYEFPDAIIRRAAEGIRGLDRAASQPRVSGVQGLQLGASLSPMLQQYALTGVAASVPKTSDASCVRTVASEQAKLSEWELRQPDGAAT
jgi:hypothetical protein